MIAAAMNREMMRVLFFSDFIFYLTVDVVDFIYYIIVI